MRHVTLTVLGLLFLAPGTARAECVFEPTYFTLEHYQETPFVDWVTWRQEDLTAGILMRNGDAISVQHWACESLGISAAMIVRPATETEAAAREKLAELAGVVLGLGEREDLAKDVAEKPWVFDTVHEITGGPENRPEFTYRYRQMDGYDLLEIRYYYN